MAVTGPYPPPTPACTASAMPPSSRLGFPPPSALSIPAKCSPSCTTWRTCTRLKSRFPSPFAPSPNPRACSERHVRLTCRDQFVSTRLLERIIPDIQSALMMPNKGGAAAPFDHDAAAPGFLWDPSQGEVQEGDCSPLKLTIRSLTMVVLILERVPPGLRGELTRWLLEPQAGVFVGRVSALVRERLWEKACAQARDGGCLILYSSDNEQGFNVRTWGRTDRSIDDFEGLFLVRVP